MNGVVQGSVQGSPAEAWTDDERVIWCTLMMLADSRGEVRCTLAELAADATGDAVEAVPLTVDEVQAAISHFGSRLERLDPLGSGWRIVNFDHYRATGASLLNPDPDKPDRRFNRLVIDDQVVS